MVSFTLAGLWRRNFKAPMWYFFSSRIIQEPEKWVKKNSLQPWLFEKTNKNNLKKPPEVHNINNYQIYSGFNYTTVEWEINILSSLRVQMPKAAFSNQYTILLYKCPKSSSTHKLFTIKSLVVNFLLQWKMPDEIWLELTYLAKQISTTLHNNHNTYILSWKIVRNGGEFVPPPRCCQW